MFSLNLHETLKEIEGKQVSRPAGAVQIVDLWRSSQIT